MFIKFPTGGEYFLRVPLKRKTKRNDTFISMLQSWHFCFLMIHIPHRWSGWHFGNRIQKASRLLFFFFNQISRSQFTYSFFCLCNEMMTCTDFSHTVSRSIPRSNFPGATVKDGGKIHGNGLSRIPSIQWLTIFQGRVLEQSSFLWEKRNKRWDCCSQSHNVDPNLQH